MDMEVIYIVEAIIGIVLALKTVMIIPERQSWVIQRLGKFNRICRPGLQLKIPFIEAVASKENVPEVKKV